MKFKIGDYRAEIVLQGAGSRRAGRQLCRRLYHAASAQVCHRQKQSLMAAGNGALANYVPVDWRGEIDLMSPDMKSMVAAIMRKATR
jgi:hypothetical protein